MKKSTADAINILGQFCGMRDVECLNTEALMAKYSIPQADVFVLFGGSILAGGDLLAQAIKDQIAKVYVIVGGAGHTTEALRQKVHSEYPAIETSGLPEAKVFQRYLKEVYSCKADYLETKSTNCGNNITYLLDLLKENQVKCSSIKNDTLTYSELIHGMWDIDRYINLLMGEIPRLRDDENGYGPKGKNFIAHVDIPEAVDEAFKQLKTVYGDITRAANPEYASR